MQADPHKLDFRNDFLARLPGAGGLGPLGPMGGGLPPTHDLTRPPSLFSAAGTSLHIFWPFSQDQLEKYCIISIVCYEISNMQHNKKDFFSRFTSAHIFLS